MKKSMLLISLLLLVSFGCQKDEIIADQESELMSTMRIDDSAHAFEFMSVKAAETAPNGSIFRSQKKEVKLVPLKGDILQLRDGNPLPCFGLPIVDHLTDVSGHLTHLGNVAGGATQMLNCRMEVLDGVTTKITADVVGHFSAANKEVLTYEGEVWLLFENGIPVGGGNFFDIKGGTGRWENAAGYFTLSWVEYPDNMNLYTVTGEVTPPGKNHGKL